MQCGAPTSRGSPCQQNVPCRYHPNPNPNPNPNNQQQHPGAAGPGLALDPAVLAIGHINIRSAFVFIRPTQPGHVSGTITLAPGLVLPRAIFDTGCSTHLFQLPDVAALDILHNNFGKSNWEIRTGRGVGGIRHVVLMIFRPAGFHIELAAGRFVHLTYLRFGLCGEDADALQQRPWYSQKINGYQHKQQQQQLPNRQAAQEQQQLVQDAAKAYAAANVSIPRSENNLLGQDFMAHANNCIIGDPRFCFIIPVGGLANTWNFWQNVNNVVNAHIMHVRNDIHGYDHIEAGESQPGEDDHEFVDPMSDPEYFQD